MNNLRAQQVRACPAGKKLGDGGGLRFVHDKGGRRFWEFRFQMHGKRYTLGAGGAATTLAEARAKRDEYRAQIAQGINPALVARQQKLATPTGQLLSRTSTVAAVAEHYVRAMGAEWSCAKHRKQWLRPLELHLPALMATPLCDVSINTVLLELEPIWHTRTETAKRAQQRLSKVFQWAIVRELYDRANPADWARLQYTLPRPSKIRPVQHFAAMPHAQLPSFWRYMARSEATSVECLRFAILTAARSGEARGARWSEIDLDARVWSIPGERMKGRRDHRVPLSAEAVAVLRRRLRFRMIDGDGLIFPGERSGRVLTDVALAKSIKRYGGDFTIHGFRSSFRDWATEQPDHDDLAAEISLAHMDRDKVRAAYRRTDLFEKRRALMADWGRYVTGGSPAGKVVPIEARRAGGEP